MFARGETARLTVPANDCYLLELERVTKPNDVVLAGVPGEVTLKEGRLEIMQNVGKPGTTTNFQVRVPDPYSV